MDCHHLISISELLREGGREGGREGEREGEREGGREGGRGEGRREVEREEGGRKEGREKGGRELWKVSIMTYRIFCYYTIWCDDLYALSPVCVHVHATETERGGRGRGVKRYNLIRQHIHSRVRYFTIFTKGRYQGIQNNLCLRNTIKVTIHQM